jgi:hypothetical protein
MAAWGLRDLLRRQPRPQLVATSLGAWWLIEAAVLPFPMALVPVADTTAVLAPPADLARADQVSPIYQHVRELPPGSVVLEFPVGDISWELRYMYASTLHWRPLVNGYSGYEPKRYRDLIEFLREPARDPDRAWTRLLTSTATHVIVHHDAYHPAGIADPTPWLEHRGAMLIAREDRASLFRIP